MKLKGTKTASNLITAFVGECQASQRYTLADKATDKKCYKHISTILEKQLKTKEFTLTLSTST